jgi:anti-anti-sigma factor
VSVDVTSWFEVSARFEGECAVLVLEGEFDMGVRERAFAALEHACRAPVLVVDLRGLTFMDTTGVHLLLEARERCRASGRRLLVVRGREHVQRGLAALDLEGEFVFVDEPVSA